MRTFKCLRVEVEEGGEGVMAVLDGQVDGAVVLLQQR